MIRTTRKQATLQLSERKLCLLIEEALLADYKRFQIPGNKVFVKFITGTYDDDLIRKIMRNYLKGGWNVYRKNITTVDKTPQGVFVVNYVILEFS